MSGCEPESRLYRLWENGASTGARMRTVDGRDVIVMSRGRRNDGAGPDFLDAVLVIGGRLRVGAVEMHRLERDWRAHGHDVDPAYAAVVLHVVGEVPHPQQLEIPTVAAASIDAPMPASAVPATFGVSREILVDCAWSRLLRRVIEITRCETDRPVDVRLHRAFVRRLFDALGYAANRRPMRQLAEVVLERDRANVPATFDSVAALLFGSGGCDLRLVRSLGSLFMGEARLEGIITGMPTATPIRWTRAIRPANVPERRLWAAARLVVELERERKLRRLLERLAGRATWNQLERELVVRFAGHSFVGESRAAEIVMNALVPVGLAAGILTASPNLIEKACSLYRSAPALESNRTLRFIEERYLGGRQLAGGFWQQGAIELHQRYLSPDHSALAYIAERHDRAYRLRP